MVSGAGTQVGLPSPGEVPTGVVASLAVDRGTVTVAVQAGGSLLQDSSKRWGTNIHVNRIVKVVTSGGVSQQASIQGNSLNTLIIRGTWVLGIEVGSEYVVLNADFMQMLRDVFGGGANISGANPLETHDPKLDEVETKLAGVLTTYGQETAPATAVNGTTWKDLLDRSVITKATSIWSITLTVAGGWAGQCKYRIVRADTGGKIFPFAAECVEGVDFFSGVPVNYPAPVVVPVSQGYKVQFRSTNAGDGAGKTCALTELAIVENG